jgi:hypothetical protein
LLFVGGGGGVVWCAGVCGCSLTYSLSIGGGGRVEAGGSWAGGYLRESGFVIVRSAWR